MHNIVIRPENIVNRCVCTIFSLEVFHAGAMKELNDIFFLALQTFLCTKPYSVKIPIWESCFCYPYHLFGLLFRWEHRERWKRCLHVLCQRRSLRLLQLSAVWPRWSWSQACQCRYSCLLLFLHIICFYDKKIRGLGGRKKKSLYFCCCSCYSCEPLQASTSVCTFVCIDTFDLFFITYTCVFHLPLTALLPVLTKTILLPHIVAKDLPWFPLRL